MNPSNGLYPTCAPDDDVVFDPPSRRLSDRPRAQAAGAALPRLRRAG